MTQATVTTSCDFVSDQCLQAGNGQGLPSFQNYGNTLGDRINHYHQAIIPTYEFQCCGEITEWGVDVQPGGRNDDMLYTLNLQVWRPLPTLASGYYNLVGNNRFTSISLNNAVAVVTPSPQDYIQYRPGDVLGFYVEEARNSDGGVVVITDSSFTSELVWQASVASQPVLGCPVSVGSSGDLNTMLRAAPVISISTGKQI